MSSINRFLSRRDKSGSARKEKTKHHGGPLKGIFVAEEKEPEQQPEKEDERKIKLLFQRLSQAGINTFKEEDISHILASAYAQGDADKAYALMTLLEDSEQGKIRGYDPSVKLLGAVNREGVTCYLDALLFAMFARLGSFEAMLYQNFEDSSKNRLATLLRLWVNALRAGKLITTDITKQIQLQLSSCGWKGAEQLCQQDASEAFTFITSTLALPLLTLKMDIFHTGKEDISDDHKFVNERLLELAVPDEPQDGHVITMEECLEMYFNNRIEVKRYLDRLERRNTINSMRSRHSVDSTKANAMHIEIAEVKDESQPSSPITLPAQSPATPVNPSRPALQRKRAPSIIQEHYVDEKKGLSEYSPSIDEKSPLTGRVRKEVMMPAWQFFSLIPWYTNNVPSNDKQVAAHFSSTRPILGICLKRYSMLPNGTAVKRKTHIDIPLEIGLPHFIQDDNMSDDGPAFGNFKLSLQSVVCHQGVSTESGHYLSLVRNPNPDPMAEDGWMRFDDLAGERVTDTDVETFLRQESPYLLFYQVIPIEGDLRSASFANEPPIMSGDQPPAYSESDRSWNSKVDSGVSGLSTSYTSNEGSRSEIHKPSFEIRRQSTDMSTSEDGRKERVSMTSDRQGSVFVSDVGTTNVSGASNNILNASDPSLNQIDGPTTVPNSGQALKPNSTGPRSRPSSRSNEKRMSATFSRLANRLSKDKLDRTMDPTANVDNPRNSLTISTAQPTQVNNPPALVAVTEKAVAANESTSDKGRLKKEAKEEKKAAQREQQHLTKAKRKETKPDRECLVM